ncbi:hypothetical protein [Noviherbaspirillum humi]|nr:hypothetical protein [Noviherbaspirillum humi]
MDKIVVSNDSDAVALLERFLNEDIDPSVVEFNGWPVYTLYLKGEKYHQSITPSLMRPLLELQKGLYKTAARVIYNDDNTNRLTDEQRGQFEYTLKVYEGSSDTNANLQDVFTGIAQSAIKKMNGKQIMIVLLAAGLLYTGHGAYEKYIDHLDKVDTNSTAVKNQEILAKSLKDQQDASLKQMQVLAAAVKQYPDVKRTQEEAQEVHFSVLKEARDADEVMVNGVPVTGAKARELTDEQRKKSEKAVFVEEFRVLAVDTTDASSTKVRVRNAKHEFWASFKDHTLDSKAINILQKHLVSRERVRLRIEGKRLGGKVQNASIIAVAPKQGEKGS